MNLYSLFITLSLLNIPSGINDIDPVLESFSKTVNISAQISPVKSADIGELVDLVCFDSILVINEAFQESIFKYFNLHSGELINDFINRGRGPNELNAAGYLLTRYNNDNFSIFEHTRDASIFFNISEMVENENKFSKVVKIEVPEVLITQCFPVNDSIYVLTGGFENGKYCLYNSTTKTILQGIDYPIDRKHEDENNFIRGMAHQGDIAIKPDGKQFVFACSFSGYFDICTISSDELHLKKRNLYYLSEYKQMDGDYIGVSQSAGSDYAFHSVSCTNDFIYMVYSGKSIAEFGSEYTAGNNILVYDWDGNPVVHFKTDRLLKRMDMPTKNLIVGYSLDPTTAEPEIITFQLPEY